MLIYDKSERELRHRILLSFFVVETLTIKESVARLDLQMVISEIQRYDGGRRTGKAGNILSQHIDV